jgi:hypothetical protein
MDISSNFSQWFVDSTDAGTYDPFAAKDVATVGLGDELQGSGRVTAFNGFVNPTFPGDLGFCVSCELTYEFGGLLSDGAGGFTTAGAFLNFYAETGLDIDLAYTPGATPNTWLELSLDTLAFSNTAGVGAYIGGSILATFSATGGLAMANFDTDSAGGGSDVAYAASALFALEQPGNPVYNAVNNRYLYSAGTTAGFTGDTVAVPEPNTLALAGLALLAVGGFRRRRFNK